MNFIDLCAGIGGIRLGLEQAGHKCVGFCEFDKFALQSYKAIHDTTDEVEYHDITAVTDDEIRELAKSRRIDIIAGGFPCQAFSVAGKRQGFDDTRGTIFFEIARFINIIKPRYFICENVKGLFSHDKGRTFRTILGAMAELGYCVEWQVLNSKDFGVPQNRERIFLVGHLGTGSGGKVFPIFGADGENTSELQDTRKAVRLGNIYGRNKGTGYTGNVWDKNHICPTLDTAQGGNRMPLILDDIEKAKTTKGVIVADQALKETNEACTLDANYFKGLGCNQARTDVLVAPVLTPDRMEKRQNGRRMKEPGEPAFTLTAQDRHGVAIIPNEINVIGNYSPSNHEASRVVHPEGVAPCVKENHGTVTAVAVPEIIDVYNKRKITNGICGTLTANGNTSSTHCGTFGVVVDEKMDFAKLPAIVDDQGRTTKQLELKDYVPTLRAQSHGNEPKVIDAIYNNRPPRETDICPTLRSERQGLLVKEATKQGYAEAFEGDSVNLAQPTSETRRGRVGKGIANTITCQDHMGVVDGIRIRKLTPRECWRLQGFPDEYFDRAKAAGVSDSQLYKQAGNAVTVNVAAAIGHKLAEISAEPIEVGQEEPARVERLSPTVRIAKQSNRTKLRRGWR